VGLHFVISGDRTAFTSRLASAVAARLVLRQTDRNDFALMGLNPREVPTRMPNGRAVWAQTGHEVQIAALGPDASAGGQVDALAGLVQEAIERWPAPRAERRVRRVEPLPVRISLTAALEATPAGCGDALVNLGVGGDELEAVVVDLLDAGPGFVVAGPARSGRSSALATAVRSLSGREDGTRAVVIVTPRPSLLRDLADLRGVAEVFTDGATLGTDLPRALDALGGPAALVVDDAEMITDAGATRVLEALVRSARDSGLVILAGATTEDLVLSRYRGWLAEARRSRSGLLLTPGASSEGELFDLRLPRSTSGVAWPAGRGYLARRGHGTLVQVALAD
jgi:S-DNA-T family DNA segregation ATPase FtsK/SpoIIIE